MKRFKLPNKFPPGGVQFHEPSLKWRAPYPLSETLDRLVDRVIALRRNNPRARLTTDPVAVRNEIEAYNCARVPQWCYEAREVTPTPLPNRKPFVPGRHNAGKKGGCPACGR